MLFTVEPGILISREALGIRIESNIHHKRSAGLMKNIPVEPEEIEELMASGK